MAGSVNLVILTGNLGKDPEVRPTQNGKKICNLSLATSEAWTDRASGERKERTAWHRVTIYNERIVGYVEQYARKGSKVHVQGALQYRKWTDQSGQERLQTEIEVGAYKGDVVLLSDGSSGRQQQDAGQRAQQPHRGGGALEDDEVPFAPCWQ